MTPEEQEYAKNLINNHKLIIKTRAFLDDMSMVLNSLENQKVPGTGKKTYQYASKLDALLKEWKQL